MLAPGAGRRQLVKDPVLERLTEQLATGLERSSPAQLVHDADIREEELRRDDDASFGTLGVRRKPASEQGVPEDLEVGLHRVTRHTAVRRDVREVDQIGVRQRGHVEKP